MTPSPRLQVFDPVKMRTKGTEAEKFVAKGKHLQEKPAVRVLLFNLYSFGLMFYCY